MKVLHRDENGFNFEKLKNIIKELINYKEYQGYTLKLRIRGNELDVGGLKIFNTSHGEKLGIYPYKKEHLRYPINLIDFYWLTSQTDYYLQGDIVVCNTRAEYSYNHVNLIEISLDEESKEIMFIGEYIRCDWMKN